MRKIAEHELQIKEEEGDWQLRGVTGLGTGTAHDPEKEWLSRIIERLNDLFASETLTDKDRLNYMNTIKDKVMENSLVAAQVESNTPDQILLGDFPKAVQDAVMASMDSHKEMSSEILRDVKIAEKFVGLLLESIFHEREHRAE